MNRIDFTKTGGFPLSQNTLDFLQSEFRDVFGCVALLLGDLVILSGVEITGPYVRSAGWVCINGEILPFQGGTETTNVIIQETSESVTFHDDENGDGNAEVKPVYFTRSAKFGSGVTQYAFASFKRLSSIKDLTTDKVDKVTGKGLSANDFSNIYKSKLDALNTILTQIKPVDPDLTLTSGSPNGTIDLTSVETPISLVWLRVYFVGGNNSQGVLSFREHGDNYNLARISQPVSNQTFENTLCLPLIDKMLDVSLATYAGSAPSAQIFVTAYK